MPEANLNRPNMEYSGPEWAALRNWIKEELDTTLIRMLNGDLPESKTQQLRGRALLLKQMLDFPEADAALRPRE
jgi:hypothetical protein